MSMHKFDPSLATKPGETQRCAVCGGTERQSQHQVGHIDQYQAALVAANAKRLAGAAAKRDIVAGRLSLTDALTDPRLSHVPIDAVLAAAPGWSLTSARDFLARLGVRENKPAGSLIGPQRDRIASCLAGSQEQAA